MKKLIIALAAVVIVGGGAYFISKSFSGSEVVKNDKSRDAAANATPQTGGQKPTSRTKDTTQKNTAESVIGKSAEGRDIVAYTYGTGDKGLLFVGGIHGGYEWNTVLVAYELMDYLKANPSAIPASVKVTVIPVLNPDGLNKIVGTAGRFAAEDVPSNTVAGRFNANNVDLNRNFDCGWQSKGMWQNKTVSGGSKAFSELESQALKSYVEASKPTAAVVWYSAAGGVYASSCNGGILPNTTKIMSAYAEASDYPAYNSFDSYETTGDMVNWLAKKNIPAISVLLTNHEDTEWTKNKAGIEAVLNYLAQ